MTKPTRALRKAVADLREGDPALVCQDYNLFTGGGCEDEGFDLLLKMIDAADHDGIVRRTWSELGKPRALDDLRFVGVVTGKSGAYRLDREAILTKAAQARRSQAACNAAHRAHERVIAHDLEPYRRA